jgi:hypothetical protein
MLTSSISLQGSVAVFVTLFCKIASGKKFGENDCFSMRLFHIRLNNAHQDLRKGTRSDGRRTKVFINCIQMVAIIAFRSSLTQGERKRVAL